MNFVKLCSWVLACEIKVTDLRAPSQWTAHFSVIKGRALWSPAGATRASLVVIWAESVQGKNSRAMRENCKGCLKAFLQSVLSRPYTTLLEIRDFILLPIQSGSNVKGQHGKKFVLTSTESVSNWKKCFQLIKHVGLKGLSWDIDFSYMLWSVYVHRHIDVCICGMSYHPCCNSPSLRLGPVTLK